MLISARSGHLGEHLTTLHVWIWYPNPAGLYSSTNPLVAPFNGG